MDYREVQNFTPIEIITGDSAPTMSKVIRKEEEICRDKKLKLFYREHGLNQGDL